MFARSSSKLSTSRRTLYAGPPVAPPCARSCSTPPQGYQSKSGAARPTLSSVPSHVLPARLEAVAGHLHDGPPRILHLNAVHDAEAMAQLQHTARRATTPRGPELVRRVHRPRRPASCRNCQRVALGAVPRHGQFDLWAWRRQVLARCPPQVREGCSPGQVGRNSPCACGSGKKYKKCCLAA